MRLGDIGQLFDGPHATPERLNEGPYFLNISSLRRGRLDLSQSDHISEENYRHWTSRVTPRSGDLLFSYETRLGEAALMPKGIRAALGRRMALIRPNRKIVDPIFLLYWYLSPEMQTLIDQRQVLGATVPRILLSELPDWPISLPPLAEQRAIAEVLGALDDKIAANRKIHELTGELTKNLFCRFAAGREDVVLGTVAEVNTAKVRPSKGILRYIDIASVSEGDYSSPEVMDWKDAPSRARRGVRRGDTIWSTVRPNRRSHALVLEDDPCLVCSTGLVTLSPLGEGFSFVYEASRARRFAEYLLSVAEGSAYPAVTASKFAHAPVPKATGEEISQFNAQCDPLWERAASAKAESRTLASLRDTLLPALMNGTLHVKDAEKQVSGVL